jgi:hypothetical protein
MRTSAALLLAALAAAVAAPSALASPCATTPVHHTPYPGKAPGLGGLPWVAGGADSNGMVALLWYWPTRWSGDEGRIFTRGHAPGKVNTKVLWAFLGPQAPKLDAGDDLVVRGRRLDGRGSFRSEFAPIGYAGQENAPSWASIVVVPTPGCWRITATAGKLRGAVTLRAIVAR